jgi:hypothetical protein
VAGAGLFRIGAGGEVFGWSERRQHFVQTYFTTPVDHETLAVDVLRLSEALRMDIGIFDADGNLIVSGGGPFPRNSDAISSWRGVDRGSFVAGVLGDGSRVIARFRPQTH